MNTSAHTVSLIIPVYNREKVIEECIRSVQDQSYQQFEILLIDDGSTDNTVAICEDLAAQDSRIKFFTSTHVGVSGARNIGLDAATGEFIFFLDSDDIIHPQLLEVLVSGIENHSAAMAGTNCASSNEENWCKVKERFIQTLCAPELTYHTHEESLAAMFKGGSPLNLIGGMMMRRDWIGDTRFQTDLFIGEDFYFIYENLRKGADTVFLSQKGYLVRHHAGSTSRQFDFNAFWTRFYRRKLVWESEASFGREEYVRIQKRDAFSCFTRCFPKNNPYSTDSRKMRDVLKAHKQDILPVLSQNNRLFYCLCCYFPGTAWLLLWLLNQQKRLKARIAKRRQAK